MTTATKPDTADLMLVLEVAKSWERAIEKAFAPWQIGVAQYRILDYVERAHGKLTPSMLAALLVQETHSISGLLNRLEDADYITRTRDRQDRRVVWVDLTLTGRTTLQAARLSYHDLASTFASVSLSVPTPELALGVLAAGGRTLAGVREDLRAEALNRLESRD